MSENSKPVALIVDDEVAIQRLLRIALENEGYTVYEAETGHAALTEIVYRKPDVIILDLALPDIDGLAVLRRLREWSQVPVLVLSVREEVQDKVTALDLGADDYLTKPFAADELAARLRVLRRNSRQEPEDPVFTSAHLEVDFPSRQVRFDGQEVRLTNNEYALLRVLVKYNGKVVTHRQLLREVWGPNACDQSQYLRVYVNHLRKKLQSKQLSTSLIQTEPGIGYRLNTLS
ncbi:MAG: response regulator [Kiritimatiellae bacterium]|nr:response regulator [Kiritimatiellia bacterium]